MANLARASKSVNLQFISGITLLFFATYTIAGPTGYRGHSCVSYCKEATKFKYDIGNTYVYDYTADIRTLILEETSQNAGVLLSTKVEIEPLTSCEFKLQLRELSLKDSDPENVENVQNAEYFTQELEKYSTRFAFQDGKIEHLCSNPEEPVWVTNIKRGLLSLFHNTVDDLTSESELQETDVNGRCRTRYEPSEATWGGSDSLRKYKDLTTCTHRQNHITAIQSIPFSSNSGTNGMHLLSGKVECDQIIRNHKIERIQCHQELKFKPFNDKNSGAKNVITQTLSLVTSYLSSSSQKGEHEMKRKSLLFEIDRLTDSTQNEIEIVVRLLEKLKKTNIPVVKAEAPALFIELVEVLRQISEEGLQLILKRTTKTTKKILLDAIPLVNSAASLGIMRDFFLQGQLTNDQIDSWLRSITFIKFPTLSMISTLSPLLEKHPETAVLFSVSSLINSYCTNVAADCQKDNYIQEAMERIASPLKRSCQGQLDVPESRKAVVALKSLGNTGIYPLTEASENVPILQKCMMQPSNSLEIRLAAIEAHRRMPCSSFSIFPFLELYANTKESTEIRIKAYLISMNCADLTTIETIKSVMQTEVVNQVGSFVWTHLTNLQETGRQDKQAIKSLVSNEFLKNKFQTDARKFSRNYESSMFWDEWNAGAGMDGNVIFTEESFLPKSGMINLTVQIFGESVNLLEFGGRIHAPERLLEPIFGPNGYFPDESMTDFLKSSRRKRDVGDNEIERLPSVYEQASTRLEKTPGGSFYARIFGHEVMYKDFEVKTESSIPNVVDESGKNWFNIKTILDNLSTGKKAEFTKSTILMDISYSVPTSAGIPLSLAVKSAATVGLSAEGKFNVGKFIENRELDILGYIRPNTAINVDASLTVRLGARNRYIRSGLSVRNILRSSTALETQLVVNGFKTVKASINLPQDRQDIFEASSTVLMLRTSGKEVVLKPLPGTPTITNQACTGNQYSEFLGLKICGELSLPDHFTFTPTSPALVLLFVEKTDTFNGYQIDYNFESGPSATKMDAIFDTPGSKINRRTALTFRKEAVGRYQTTIETPTKVFTAEGTYSQFQKSFDLTVMDEGERLLHLNTSILKVGNKIEPTFQLVFFKRPLAELTGVIEIPSHSGDQKRATVDLVLKHITETPVRINGNFVTNGETNEANLGIESYYLTGNIRSQIRKKLGHWSTKSVLEYSWKHGKINTVDINAKLQQSQKGALSKLSTAATFTMSNFPEHGVEWSWDTQSSHGFCENSLKFTIGKSTWDGHTLFSRQSTREQNEIRMQMSLVNPRNDMDYHVEFMHKINEYLISTRFIGRTSTENEVKANFDYGSTSRPFLRKTLTAETTWPGEYSFRAALQEKKKGEFEGELFIGLNKTKEMKGTISYMNNSNNLKLDHILEFRARGFSSVPISGSLVFSATDKQSHIGCNIQLEGKKPYSSRLSTSVDYSHSKNSHKIEAKVTFNEKKYNGEITFGHIKSGTRHLTVDLHLNNHIFLDAKMAGMFPETMIASISLVPNKDKHPQEKLELKGTLDSRNLGLNFNYFGEKMSFNGGYGEGFITGEAVWFTDQRFMISVQARTLSNSESSVSLFVATPLDGFRNASVYWEHISTLSRLEIKFGGNIEEKSALVQFKTLANPSEITGKALVEITGVSKLQGDIFLQRNGTGNIKNFKFSIKKGAQGVIDADYLNHLDESSVRFDFRGLSLLPEVLFHWKSIDRVSALGLEWRLPETSRHVVHLKLEKKFDPISYDFSITTPFSTLQEIHGNITLDRLSPTYKLEVRTKGDFNLVPSKISVGIQGTTSAFNHYVSTIWRSKELYISLQGGITRLDNAQLTVSLNVPERSCKFNILSKLESKVYKAEIKTNFDTQEREAGLTIDLSSIPEKLYATAWRIIPSENRKELAISYDNSGETKTFLFDAKDDNRVILKLEGALNSENYTFWSLHTSLDSSINFLPSFTFQSDHNMININNIHHKLLLNVLPLGGSFWTELLPARDFSMEFDIKNQDTVSGGVNYGTKTVRIDGGIHETPNGHNFQLRILPSGHKSIEVKTGYEFSDGQLGVTGIIKSNDETTFEADIGASKSSGTYSGNLFVKSSFTHTFDGQIAVDAIRWMAKVFLKKNDVYVIHLNANAQVHLMQGNLKITVESSMFPSIEDVKTELKYKVESSGVSAEVTYATSTRRYHISMDGVWKEIQKSLQLSSKGDFVGQIDLIMENWNKISARVSHNQKKLGEIILEYETHMGDFMWGKHDVHMKYVDSTGRSTLISVSLGVDPKRFNIEIQTPFQSWTQIKAYGHLDLQNMTSKLVKIGLNKEQDRMESVLEMKTFKRNGTTSIATEISVIGFSRLRKFLLDTVDLKNLTNQLSPEQPEKFAALVRWSSSNVNVEFKTPLQQWKDVALTGSWELIRSQRHIHLKVDIDNKMYEFRASGKLEKGKGETQIIVQANSLYKLEGSYDFTNNFEAGVKATAPTGQWNLKGKVIVNKDFIQIEATTPFPGYEEIIGKASYRLQSNNHQVGTLEWTINKESHKIHAEIIRGTTLCTIKLVTPFKPWDDITVTLNHDISFSNMQFKANRGDEKLISIIFVADTMGNITAMSDPASSKLEVKIETQFVGFEDTILSLNYDRTASQQKATILYNRNQNEMEGQLDLLYQNTKPLALDINARMSSGTEIVYKARAAISIGFFGRNTLSALVEANNTKHEINAIADISSTKSSANLQTSLQFLKTVELSLDISKGITFHGLWEGNKKRAEIETTFIYNGFTHGSFNLSLATPVSGLRNINIDFKLNAVSEKIDAALTIQNEDHRWMAKVEGRYDQESGDWKTLIHTPLENYQDLAISLKHTWTFDVKEISCSVERGSVKLLELETSLRDSGFQFSSISGLFEYPIAINSMVTWNDSPLNIQLTLSGGDEDYRTNVELNIKGKMSGMIHLRTSVLPDLNSSLSWNAEGTFKNGNAWASMNNTVLGTRSLRTLWRIETYNQLKFELWTRSMQDQEEKGGTINYSVTSDTNGNKRFNAQLILTPKKGTDSISTSVRIKQQASKYEADIQLQTPFNALKKFEAEGVITIESEIVTKISCNYNDVHLATMEGSLELNRSKSVLTFNLNAPVICKPFQMQALYNFSSTKKTIEIFYKQGNYIFSLKNDLVIPDTSKEIEINLNVSSNVPFAPLAIRGTIKGSYQVHPNGISELTLVMESTQAGNWRFVGALRATSDFYLKLNLVTSDESSIPSTFVETNWKGSLLQGISSNFKFVLGELEYKANLFVSTTQFRFDFNSDLEGFKTISLEGILNLDSQNKQIEVKVDINGEQYLVTSDCDFSSGKSTGTATIILALPKENEKIGSLTLLLENAGTVDLTGSWRGHEIKLHGYLQGTDKNVKWLTSGVTDLTLDIDGTEQIAIHSNHDFKENEYSLNLTAGPSKIIKIHFSKGPHSVIASTVQWNTDGRVKLLVELRPDKFDVSFSSPWTADLVMHGVLQTSSEDSTAEGYVIYDKTKSSMKLKMLSNNDTSNFEIALNIPTLHQKLETTVSVQAADAHRSGGKIDMTMNGRHMSLTSQLSTNLAASKLSKKQKESRLLLSLSLPSGTLPQISAELIVTRPVTHFGSMTIDGKVLMGEEVSVLSMSYDIPILGNQLLGFTCSWKSPFNGPNNYELVLKSEGNNFKNFNGQLMYKQSELKLDWDIRLPKINAGLRLVTPGNHFDQNEYEFRTIGSFNISKLLNVTVNAVCKETTLYFQSFIKREGYGISSGVSINSPQLLVVPHNYRLKLIRVEDGQNHLIEVSGNQGYDSVDLVGEMSFKNGILTANTKVTGSYGSHYAKLDVTRVQQAYEGDLVLESTSLLVGKTVNIKGRMSKFDHGFEANLQCRTRKSSHSVTMTAILKSNEGLFQFKMESPTFKPLIFYSEWKKEALTVSGIISGNFMDTVSKLEAFLNMKSLEGHLSISSPFIPSSHFNFHLKAIVSTENIDILGDVNIRNAHWRLEGVLQYNNLRHMTTKLEVLSPYDSFKRLTLAVKSSENEVYTEIHTPFKLVPNAMLKITGISAIQKRNWKNMQPSISVGLPMGTFSAFTVIIAPNATHPGLLHFHFEDKVSNSHNEYEFQSQISPLGHFTLNMENTGMIHLKIVTPMPKYSLIQAKLEGRIKGKTLVKLNADGKYNEDTFSFLFDYQNENGNPKVRSEIASPFQNYEEFAFLMSVDSFQKIGEGKSLHTEFKRSGWEDTVHLDADYRYRFDGFLDMEAEVNTILGSFMDEFPKFHAYLKSGTEGSKYTGTILGSLGAQTFTMITEAEITEDDFAVLFQIPSGTERPNHILAVINLKREENEFRFHKEIMVEGEEILAISAMFSTVSQAAGGKIKLSTPWGKFESHSTVIPIIGLEDSSISFPQLFDNINVTFDSSFDGWRIFGFQLVSRNGHRVLEVHNPIRPVSVMIYLERSLNDKLKVASELCWNLDMPVGNTIGVALLLNKGFTGYDMELKIQAEEAGFIETKMSHSLTSSKFNQLISITWNSPFFKNKGECGYNIMLSKDLNMNYKNYDFVLQVDLPWRSGAIETHSNKSTKESQHTIVINWDVKRNNATSISMKLHTEEKIAWRTSESSHFLEILHPLSNQPIILTLDQIYKDNRFQHVELDIKISREPQSNFVAVISRNNTDWKNFRAVASHIPSKTYAEVHLKTVDQNMTMEFSYLDRLGMIQEFTVESSLNSDHLQFEIYSGSSELKTTAIKLHHLYNKDHSILNLRIFSMEANILVQKYLPYVQAVVKHEGEQQLRLSGGLPNKKEINIQISGAEFGKPIDYFLVTIKLNNSNTLSSRINWRPDLWSLLMKFDIPSALQSVISSDIKLSDLLHKINAEIEGRWNTVSPSVIVGIKQIKKYIAAEAILIHQEWIKAVNFLKNLYETNSFYLKDLLGSFAFVFETVNQIGEIITNGIVMMWKSAVEISMNGSDKLHGMYLKYEGKLESMVMEIWNETENFVNRVWRDNLALLSSLFDKLEYSVVTFLDAVEGRIDEVEKKFMAVGLIRKMIQLYKEYAAWIEEIPIQKYVQNVEKMLSIRIWDRLAEYLRPIIDALQNGVEDQYFKDLLETPPLPYIRFVARQINAAFVKFWKVIEVEERIKNVVRASMKHVDGLIQRYIPASSLDYNFEAGFIDYDQSLSALQWDDLTQFPRWKTSEEDAEDVNQLTNFYYQVLDKIESVKPLLDMNIRNILPPFGSYALMAGDYHYFTFDKKYFRFAGECSYLLVADLSHSEDTFSLIVNYNNKDGTARKKSYTIMSDGKLIDVDIHSFKVTVNGRKVELPLKIGSTFIHRHQTGLEIFDTRGFQMSCSLSPSVCTLWVSGWHFGKLGGLLGTYDNEQVNDLRNPEGQIIPDVSTFAYSWRVGKNSGHCRMKNYAREEAEPVDVDNICHNLLNNRSSPLRPCFNTVDTEIFMEMCKYDVYRNVNSANRAEAACPSMSAYVAECQKNNVDVWIPPTCVRCRLEDGTALTTGENATLQVDGDRPPPKSSDNVIILQQGSCVSAKAITDAIGKLDLALNSNGIWENRYAIVGFGGEGHQEKAHIKTSSAKVWSHSTLFKVPNDTDSIRADRSDLYEAVQYASTLGFRAGVSKNIIAVTCGEDQCGDSKRYADILTLLLENDIKFHLIVPKPFSVKGNRKQNETQIYGIDIIGAYTVKHAKEATLEADKSLLRQINVPKDFCTPLAIESNGTRFNFEIPTKKLMDVWSQRIAATSYPSECQRCECVPDRYGSASLMCHQCVSPSLRRFMEEWKHFKTQDGEDLIPFDLLDHDDFIIT